MGQSHQDYRPPDNLWDVYDLLNFDLPLESDDPKCVDTESGRGKFNFSQLYRYLKVDSKNLQFRGNEPPKKTYIAFCGLRGCGKSTELRKLASKLERDGLFLVVFLNASVELDTNNLEYADIFLALAKTLLERLQKLSIKIDQIYLDKLESWFNQTVIVDSRIKDHENQLKAGVEIQSGIPFLGKLFANATSAIKNNASYKKELRRVITDAFSQFAEGFNGLITAARETLPEHHRRDILFIVDDLEKLPRDCAEDIFIKNVNQLQQINSNFIYSTPIDMLYAGNQLQQVFKPVTLPMIKLEEQNGTDYGKGYEVLREMIFKRADRSLFVPVNIVDTIIKYSGGNPRHVIQLLS